MILKNVHPRPGMAPCVRRDVRTETIRQAVCARAVQAHRPRNRLTHVSQDVPARSLRDSRKCLSFRRMVENVLTDGVQRFLVADDMFHHHCVVVI